MSPSPVDGDALSVIERLCGAAVSLLSLSGAGVSLMVGGQLRGSAGGSDTGIAAVQELQLELGQGPCVEAWKGGEPVLEPDLALPLSVRWPSVAQAGVRAGVRGVFAFPMRLGAIRRGVLVFYRARSGALSSDQLAQGLVLADLASQVVLAVQAGAPADRVHELLAGEPAHWAEVHQARGWSRCSSESRWMRLSSVCARTRSRRGAHCARSPTMWCRAGCDWRQPKRRGGPALCQHAIAGFLKRSAPRGPKFDHDPRAADR